MKPRISKVSGKWVAIHDCGGKPISQEFASFVDALLYLRLFAVADWYDDRGFELRGIQWLNPQES